MTHLSLGQSCRQSFCKKGKACPVDSNETALHHQLVSHVETKGLMEKTENTPLHPLRRKCGGGEVEAES